MPSYIAQSGDLVRCYQCLTDGLTDFGLNNFTQKHLHFNFISIVTGKSIMQKILHIITSPIVFLVVYGIISTHNLNCCKFYL